VTVEPLPPEAVLASMRTALHAGAERMSPPVVQPLGQLLDLLGEGMRARVFAVEGAEDACLRPDFTVAVALEHLRRGSPGGRYAYEGPAFRAAPAGSDRPTEFLQLGVERIGEPGGERDDAEVAARAFFAAEAGGREDLQLVMGDLALFDAFCEGLGVAAPTRARLKQRMGAPEAFAAELERAPARGGEGGRLPRLLAGLPAEEAAGVLEELWAVAGVTPVGGRTPADIAARLAGRGQGAATGVSEAQRWLIARWTEIGGEPLAAIAQAMVLARRAGVDLHGRLESCAKRVAAMAAAGVSLERQRLDFGFGRPFGYYDGFLFEVRSDQLPDDAPVAAGGRYDGLLGRLRPGAEATAVGCMVRPGRAWRGNA
jgi:ATP phosphoribosyltransferase regulatory subunit